ncbi:MAG: hypothetical protein MK213_08120, partial [Planctomycetes bacterium]|nr:hypothetical protein [Planctomycetota bacterium]
MAMQIPLTGLVLLLASCGPSTGDPAPALVAQPAKLTLPQIPFGGKGEGQFSLHNTTSEVVSILGIGPTGCDCAEVKLIIPATGDVFEVSPQGMSVPLNPGMEAELHLTLDTSRYRDPVTWKTGRIPVILDRGPYLPLDYEADIWTPFWCEPWAIELGDVPMNESASG